jgi:hypothetical protein
MKYMKYVLAASMTIGMVGAASASDCIVGVGRNCVVPNPTAPQRDYRDERRDDREAWRREEMRRDEARRAQWREDRRRDEYGDRRYDPHDDYRHR